MAAGDDEADPAADPWAQRKDKVASLMCADAARWDALVAAPDGANSVEWPIEMTRAAEAAARAFWPLGNTKLEKRLGLIEAPTLVLWGDRDAVLPPSYAAKFARGINGSTRVQTIAGAGHLAYLDQPEAVARAVSGAPREQVPSAGARGRSRTVWRLDRDAASQLP